MTASALADPLLPVAGHFVFAVQAAGTRIDTAVRTLRLLAAEVLPQLSGAAHAPA